MLGSNDRQSSYFIYGSRETGATLNLVPYTLHTYEYARINVPLETKSVCCTRGRCDKKEQEKKLKKNDKDTENSYQRGEENHCNRYEIVKGIISETNLKYVTSL